MSKKLKTFFIVVLVFIVSGIIAFQLLFNGCLWWNCVPERSIELDSIEIPDRFFSENVIVHPLSDRRGGILYADEYSQRIIWDSGSVLYIVMMASNDKRAKNIFDDESRLRFFISQLENTDSVNEILIYQPSNTDIFFMRCGKILEFTECIFGAKYDEIYIFFQSNIDSEMSPGKYFEILSYLDNLYGEIVFKSQ